MVVTSCAKQKKSY